MSAPSSGSSTADRRGVRGRQVLLAFAAQQAAVFSVLTGTTSLTHLIENISDLLSAPNLFPEELAFLRGEAPRLDD